MVFLQKNEKLKKHLKNKAFGNMQPQKHYFSSAVLTFFICLQENHWFFSPFSFFAAFGLTGRAGHSSKHPVTGTQFTCCTFRPGCHHQAAGATRGDVAGLCVHPRPSPEGVSRPSNNTKCPVGPKKKRGGCDPENIIFKCVFNIFRKMSANN